MVVGGGADAGAFPPPHDPSGEENKHDPLSNTGLHSLLGEGVGEGEGERVGKVKGKLRVKDKVKLKARGKVNGKGKGK